MTSKIRYARLLPWSKHSTVRGLCQSARHDIPAMTSGLGSIRELLSGVISVVFDKAIVLYEGCEIYFGPARHAKQYFEHIG